MHSTAAEVLTDISIQSVDRTVTALLERPNCWEKPCVVQSLATGRYPIPLPDILDETTEGIFGGTEAIGHALTNIAFHLAKEKQVVGKLRQELREGSFQPNVAPNATLSRFPYLVLCFQSLKRLADVCRLLYLRRVFEPSVETFIDSREFVITISDMESI